MKKVLKVNAGTALLLNEHSDALAEYDSISMNAGSVIVSRKVYDKLSSMKVSINSGNMKVIEVDGEIAELAGNTVIDSAVSFDGSYVLCDGDLIIEDAKGLANITGMYANCLFHPESVDVNVLKNATVSRRKVYPDGAKLHMGDLSLGGDSPTVLESGLHWVNGSITTLDGDVLEKLSLKGVRFRCMRLIIRTGLYEKYGEMFSADSFVFVPDDHSFAEDITLDAATSILYGEKLFVYGDMMIAHDQAQHLSGLTSLVVHGTATMPVTAAEEFVARGKAGVYELYEGILVTINGKDTIKHEQLQTAVDKGISYTYMVNGVLVFDEGVMVDDIDAVTAVRCNGIIYAPGNVRGVLDSKIKEMNGKVVALEEYKLSKSADDNNNNVTTINAGTYRL